jgi:N-methylhydantoinase B
MPGIKMDPITFEIMIHRLWRIVEEMGITLARISGSPVTEAAKDYMMGVWDSEGDNIMTSAGVISNGATASFGVRHIIKHYSDYPGFKEGDVYLINDNMICSLHRSDIYTIAPIFYKGELISWAGTMCHLTDIGAIDPGQASPRATEMYQEGWRLTGVKIIEQGRLRQDIWDSLMSMTRDRGMVGLDLRGNFASVEVARKRVLEIIEEHGLDSYKNLCKGSIKYTETKLRAKLAELPNGTWRTIFYWDTDGMTDRVYQVVLALTKERDTLTFDFTGTSEQAPSFINCGPTGVTGGIFGTLAPFLCYDTPWNEGILRPVKIISPEATWINSKEPAPSAMGSIGGHWAVISAINDVMAKMLNCSEKYKEEVNAVWHGALAQHTIAGVSQYNRQCASPILDTMTCGGGARSDGDGVDTGSGCLWIPECIIPNVETVEFTFPLLYLSRREIIDSGGAGKYRGGTAVGNDFIVHDTPENMLTLLLYGNGSEAAVSYGAAGGFSGGNIQCRILRDSDIHERHKQGEMPVAMEELKGRVEILPTAIVTKLGANDVYHFESMAGGGYGDPLDRNPESVAKDVANKVVSLEQARDIYGVVIDTDSLVVDAEKTEEKRERIRKVRLSSQKSIELQKEKHDTAHQ